MCCRDFADAPVFDCPLPDIDSTGLFKICGWLLAEVVKRGVDAFYRSVRIQLGCAFRFTEFTSPVVKQQGQVQISGPGVIQALLQEYLPGR